MNVTKADTEDRYYFWDKDKLICSYLGNELENISFMTKVGYTFERKNYPLTQIIKGFMNGDFKMGAK